jgi:hypothetical protein
MRTVTAHGDKTPPLPSSDATNFLRNADTSPTDGTINFLEFCNALDGDSMGTVATSEGGGALDGQMHLSLTGADGEIRVTFVTKEPLIRAVVTVSTTNAESNAVTVPAITSHYTVPKRAWEPTGNGGYIHTALLSDLPPASAVNYRPHGTDSSGKAVDFGLYSFETAPSAAIATKIALLGKKFARLR